MSAGLVIDRHELDSAGEGPVEREVTCEVTQTREPDLCQTAVVDGSTYRYAVLEPDGGSKELALLDPGGPGHSALADGGVGAMVAALGVADTPSDTGLIVLEEPWVTRPVPSGTCEGSAQRYLSASREADGLATAVRDLLADCDRHEYGWARERYRDVVAGIAAGLDAPLTKFAGASFAAHRLAWLTSDPRFEIEAAALVNPLLPGLSMDDVLAHQAEAVDEIAQRLPAQGEAEGTVLAAAASQVPGYRVGERGHPRAGPEELDGLADSYIGRYGRDRMALGTLAYLQEMCAAGAAPTVSPARDDSPARAWLTALHSGCGGSADAHPIADADIDMCLVASELDGVIPFEPLESLVGSVDIVTDSAHHDISGLSHCADRLFEWN